MLAPLARPGKIIAIGLNYRDHTAETGLTAPAEPLTFAKYPTSVIGPDADIVVPPRITDAGRLGGRARASSSVAGAPPTARPTRRRRRLHRRQRRVGARPAVRATASGRAASRSTRSARSARVLVTADEVRRPARRCASGTR